MLTEATPNPVLFFDGECNLCNSSVQFFLKHDSKRIFLFAPLQSAAGAEAKRHVLESLGAVPDSMMLFYKGHYYVKSAAALNAARHLGGLWAVLYFAGIIFPRFVRDGVYDYVSRNRYKWFGKRNECMIPTPELKARFLS